MAMSRALCIPTVFILFSALVLNFLASISLPYLPGLDIARTHLTGDAIQGSQGLTEVRFGIWAPCYYDAQNDRTCLSASTAYNVTIVNGNNFVIVESSWTRGLVVQPIATFVTFLAFFFALFSTHRVMPILASLAAFLAALLTLIAFAIDIALFALIKIELDKLGTGITTNTGPGFWLTFVSLVLLLIGGCTVCCVHRRSKRSDGAIETPKTTPKTTSDKKGFWRKGKQ